MPRLLTGEKDSDLTSILLAADTRANGKTTAWFSFHSTNKQLNEIEKAYPRTHTHAHTHTTPVT